MLKNIGIRTLTIALAMAFTLVSCNRFEGDQTIPAYIHIDEITLSTNYALQGANTSNFTDAWIYINGQLQGVYELPSTFPVLKRGKHTLDVYPGIKLNGNSDTRADNAMWGSVRYEDFNFVEDSIITLTPQATYYETVQFKWMEDFETSYIKIDPDTAISKTAYDADEALLVGGTHYSGVVYLDTVNDYFQFSTPELYNLPINGNYVMLEIDYKCTNNFVVGIGGYTAQDGVFETPLVYVRPTDVWKKIYINLGPTITDNSDSQYFKVLFAGNLNTDDGNTHDEFYFDNLKVEYRIVNQY